MPKENRSPKSEVSCACAGAWVDDWHFRGVGSEAANGTLILREDAAYENRPRERDLMERTARFGEAIVKFAQQIPQTPVNIRLISQLVGAGTSVGANYCEADDAVSGKDYKKSIGVCRKESKETMFFLRMIATAEEDWAGDARKLWREAKELNLIFGALWRK